MKIPKSKCPPYLRYFAHYNEVWIDGSGDSGSCSSHWNKKRLMKYLSEDQDSYVHRRTKATKLLTPLKYIQYRGILNFSERKRKI